MKCKDFSSGVKMLQNSDRHSNKRIRRRHSTTSSRCMQHGSGQMEVPTDNIQFSRSPVHEIEYIGPPKSFFMITLLQMFPFGPLKIDTDLSPMPYHLR